MRPPIAFVLVVMFLTGTLGQLMSLPWVFIGGLLVAGILVAVAMLRFGPAEWRQDFEALLGKIGLRKRSGSGAAGPPDTP